MTRYAKLSSVNDHGMDLPLLVRPDEVVMISEGRYTDVVKGASAVPVCNVILRHGPGASVYGTAEEVEAALLSATRLN